MNFRNPFPIGDYCSIFVLRLHRKEKIGSPNVYMLTFTPCHALRPRVSYESEPITGFTLLSSDNYQSSTSPIHWLSGRNHFNQWLMAWCLTLFTLYEPRSPWYFRPMSCGRHPPLFIHHESYIRTKLALSLMGVSYF